MRVVAAVLGLALIQACAASLVASGRHEVRATSAPSPWKIVEDWTVQLPGGGMQIYPAYASVPGLYAATTSNGQVVGVNTSARGIQWQQSFDDVAFLTGHTASNTIIVSRYSGTTALDVTSGNIKWTNTSIVMSPNLSENYNVLIFGNTIVYRDQSNGFVRLCGFDVTLGFQTWCDARRTLGSPDAAFNNTFTAMLFDAEGNSYVANSNAMDGTENWIAAATSVLTGSEKWVAITKDGGAKLSILNSMTGAEQSSRSIAGLNVGTAVFVNGDVFVFGDNKNWIAAIDTISGSLLWNVSAPGTDPSRMMQLQHVGQDVLAVAVLTFSSTNFTRINPLTGAFEWTVTAKPVGMSLAPVHAWLSTDILYVRNTGNTWSAWGAESGQQISTGTGDLFLPRSVTESFSRPHFSFYVTTKAGVMINLRIELRK